MVQLVKNPPAVQEAWVRSLDWKDPLEKGYPLQYSGLENSMDCIISPWSQKSQTQLSNFHFQRLLWASLIAQLIKSACNAGDPSSIPGLGRSTGEGISYPPSILSWRIPGQIPGLNSPWGRREIDMTE